MSFSFGITTSKEFFELLMLEVDEYLNDELNIRKAMMCSMISYHLTDWLNWEINHDKKKLGKFRKNLNCPELSIMHDIINGTKHLTLDGGRGKAVADTELHVGAFSRQFSSAFDKSSLDIILKDGTKIGFEETIISVTDFWRNYFENYHP